jgi:inositol polyphosphate-4-phosphatase
MATLAESLGSTRPQDKSNLDNYERVNEYYYRFRKLHLPADPPGQRGKIIGFIHIIIILSIRPG